MECPCGNMIYGPQPVDDEVPTAGVNVKCLNCDTKWRIVATLNLDVTQEDQKLISAGLALCEALIPVMTRSWAVGVTRLP